MPGYQKFDIFLMKPFHDLSILLSSIPIYLTYVLHGVNPLFHLTKCAFYKEMPTYYMVCKIP